VRLRLGRGARRALVCLGLWWAAWLWAVRHPREVSPAVAAGDGVLLEEARQLQRSLRGAGEERSSLRSEVAQCLVDLSRRCRTPAARAELLFDASELSAAGGELLLALTQCVAASRVARLKRRSELELEAAHLERRLGRLNPAGRGYLRLASNSLLSGPDRDQAAHWCARMAEEQGRTRLAQERWRVLARTAILPERRLLAYERLAMSLARDGSLAEAQKTFQELESTLGPHFQAATQQGERLRHAYVGTLQRLKCEFQLHEQ